MGRTPVKKEEAKNKKGALTAHGRLKAEPVRGKDAFVLFGGRHPPLDATFLQTFVGLCQQRKQAACQPATKMRCY